MRVIDVMLNIDFLVFIHKFSNLLHSRGALLELKEFISQAITQIVDGVNEAQVNTANSTAQVNPKLIKRVGEPEMGITPTRRGMASIFQFDIALTATKGTDTKGGIGVVSGLINLGSAGASSAENSTVSRVKFSVPVQLPENLTPE